MSVGIVRGRPKEAGRFLLFIFSIASPATMRALLHSCRWVALFRNLCPFAFAASRTNAFEQGIFGNVGVTRQG